MSKTIRIVAEKSRKTTIGKTITANLKLVLYKTGYDRERISLHRSVEVKDWDKNKEQFLRDSGSGWKHG